LFYKLYKVLLIIYNNIYINYKHFILNYKLGLAVYQRQFYIEDGAISAGAVVTIIPMLVVFTILRKNILQGFTTSGIKE